MLQILLYFLVFIVILTLMARGISLLMGRVLGRAIADKHKAADVIYNENKPPEVWIQPFVTKIETARKDSAAERKIEKLKNKAKEELLLKMDRLIHYFTKTPCFDSKDTQKILLDKMETIRKQWESSEWESIVESVSAAKTEEIEE